MEPFTLYVIVCVSMYCRDIAPSQPKFFVDQQSCSSYVGDMLISFRKAALENKLTIVDARAFCMAISEPEGSKT